MACQGLKIRVNTYEDTYVKDVYNKISDHFNLTRSYQWEWITDFTKEYQNTDVVYDIGCGSGRNLRSKSKWIGFDNSIEFVKQCQKKGCNAQLCDMTELPVQNESADAILSIASFHHLYTLERRIDALKEMYRVLKYKGKVLLSVWSIDQPKKTRRTFHYGDNLVSWNKYGEIYNRYYYIFQKEELEKLFELCKFTIIDYKWDCGNEIYTLQKL